MKKRYGILILGTFACAAYDSKPMLEISHIIIQ